ncbi:hypothetical protein FRC06_011294 [Ceratobasidium sp. 370]|nr:hypothetical protein FRC06_011294 [Ceratobasidium sp. 370]
MELESEPAGVHTGGKATPRRQTPDPRLGSTVEGGSEVAELLVECKEQLPVAHELLVGTGGGAQWLVFDKKEGVFVEHFPDSHAGMPISDKVAYMPDISDYMAAVGNLGDPTHFATAELLLATGLTAAGHTTHLQSHMQCDKALAIAVYSRRQ